VCLGWWVGGYWVGWLFGWLISVCLGWWMGGYWVGWLFGCLVVWLID